MYSKTSLLCTTNYIWRGSVTISEHDLTELESWFDLLVDQPKESQQKELKKIESNSQLSTKQLEILKKMLSAAKGTEFATIASQYVKKSTTDITGHQIGPYEIIEPLGHGGMGQVFLAVRNDGEFDQQVALKLSYDYIDDSIRERFENERQILAQLNHPNIAHLLDGGTTEQNKPYIAMEYVKGLPIDQYCKQSKPNLKIRIGLILQACDAVSYAHNNLILHRDLKPDNILVSQSGWVKLLDFGIAKLMDEELNNKTATQIMTRNYASPEQIQGKTLSVQSDLFSLGVIAFELITGHHPFPHRNALEREQHVVSGKVLRISQRTTQETVLHPHLDNIPNALLEGDLENILRKTLAVEPEKRYDSISDFAQDLRNFLGNRPIKARKPSLIYVINKWVQRHKAVSIISIFSVLSLVSATVFSFHKASEALEQKQIAESESTRATKISNFMQSIFTNAKPHSGKEELTARALLDQGFESLQTDLADDPESKYKIMVTMLGAYRTLSEYKKITSVYDNHYQACVSALSETAEPCQKILWYMARSVLKLYGDEMSLVYFYKAIKIARRSQPIDHLLLGTLLRDLFVPLVNLKRFDEALKTTEEGLEHLETAGISDTDLAYTYHDLAVFFIKKGHFNEAEKYIQKEEAIFNQMSPIDYFNIAQLENLKGYFYLIQKDYPEAVFWRKKSVETFKTRFNRPSESLAYIQLALAKTIYKNGNVKEAIEQAREAISVYESLGKTDQTNHQNAVLFLAQALFESGNYDGGMLHFNQVNQIKIPYLKCNYERNAAFIQLFVNHSFSEKDFISEYIQCADEKGTIAEDSAIYIPLFQMKYAVMSNQLKEANKFSQILEQFWQDNPQELPILKNIYLQLKEELVAIRSKATEAVV